MPVTGTPRDGRPELIVLVGLQASGKSTFYARTFAGTHAHVSKDLFRRARHRQRRQMRLVEEALAEGVPVVVDNTNPSPHEWAPLIAAGRAHGVRVLAYWFPPDVAGALARNAARQGPERVPDVGVYATLKRLRRPRRSDGFDAVYEVRFDGEGGFLVDPAEEPGPGHESTWGLDMPLWPASGTEPRPLAVFDLDGTLADVRHRLHHLESRPRDWDAFFAAARQDPPLAEGVALLTAAAQGCEVAYVTGRPEHCRQDTLDWLVRHDLPEGQLLMRSRGDRRPARVCKPELLRGLARDRAVAMVADDDRQVCDAYEAEGFQVLRATWMARQPLLERVQESEGRT